MTKKGHQSSIYMPNPHKRDASQFRSQVEALGLKIIKVIADGNCFFRCLGDQLEGNEAEHGKYRLMVVDYIKKNRSSFEPFIEVGLPFDEYCAIMEKSGSWAGNMELQAASLATRSNICIHQFKLPRLYLRNFEETGTFMIHISYLDDHYNSVRMKDDPCDGSSIPISIEADSKKFPAAMLKRSEPYTASLKVVMAGSGCEDARKAQDVLNEVDGDVDAAIEYLIAEQQTEEFYGAEGKEMENEEVPVPENTTNFSDVSKEKDNVVKFERKKTRKISNCKRNGKVKIKRVLLNLNASNKAVSSAFPDVGALHI